MTGNWNEQHHRTGNKKKWRDIVTIVIYRNAWTGLDDYRVYVFHINEQTLKIILITEIYTCCLQQNNQSTEYAAIK